MLVNEAQHPLDAAQVLIDRDKDHQMLLHDPAVLLAVKYARRLLAAVLPAQLAGVVAAGIKGSASLAHKYQGVFS
jgi:hypothetical protein